MGPFKRSNKGLRRTAVVGAVKTALVAVFCLALAVGAQEAKQDTWEWPLSISPALSSTFAETRGSSFHAGIDVKTWGRTGYPVKAIADGYIWRLRTSPWGYGRAVYQKLADGRIVVYAHLEKFNTVLTAKVEKAQKQQGRYSIDQWIEAGEIPVKRGEVIAHSGQSGAGPPHLHLELRDANNVPINPLLHGFAIPDTVSPSVQRLALIPKGIASRVNGGHEPVVLGVRYDMAQGLYVATDTVQAYGTVGFAAQTYDRANGVPNKLAPYLQTLAVNGESVFAAAYRRVSYSDAYQALLDRTRLPVAGGQAVFFNLFKYSGNRLTFYYRSVQDGWLQCTESGLGEGLHRIDLEVADVAGNTSRARLMLQVDAVPSLEHALVKNEGDWTSIEASNATAAFEVEQQPYGDFVQVTARSPVALAAVPLVVAQGDTVPVEQIGVRQYRFDLALAAEGVLELPVVLSGRGRLGQTVQTKMAVQQRPVLPNRAAHLAFDDSAAVLYFPEQSVYEVFFPQGQALVPEQTDDFVSYGIGYRFGASSVSFNRKVEVWLRCPEAVERPEQVGVYAQSYEGDWWFVGNTWNAAGRLVGTKVRQLGTYALLADTTRPVVRDLRPAQGETVTSLRPRLVAGVADVGSGIGSEVDIRMKLDGRLLVSEYDPDAKQVFYQTKQDLAVGPHQLDVWVKDRGGNQASAAVQFTVAP